MLTNSGLLIIWKTFDNFYHVSPQDPECCPKFIKWSNREKVYWKLNSLKNWTPCILEAQLFNFEELDWSFLRRVCSSWWTARRSPGCGECTRTSLTWTTRRWAGHSGKQIAMLHYQNIKSVWWRERHFWGAFTKHNSTWFGGISDNKIDLGPFWV